MGEVDAEKTRNEVSGWVPKKVYYEKRFGQIAIEKGFISAKDLARALAVQVDDKRNRRPSRLLGQILFVLDLITPDQIEAVLHEIFGPEPAESSMQEFTKARLSAGM